MRKTIALLLTLLMALSFTACASTAENGGTDSVSSEMRLLEPGKLIVATDATFPPYEMPAEDGVGVAGSGITGIDLEIASEIAARLELALVIEDIPFDQALYSPQNGKADILLAGVNASFDRVQFMRFSEPYASSVQVIVVPEGSPIKARADLDKKQLGTVYGMTSWILSVDEFGEDAVTVFDRYDDAFSALSDGSVDALILEEAPAKTLTEAADGWVILDENFSEAELAVGMAKENAGLQQAVNEALADMRDDGTLQSIIERYIPSDPA